MQIHRHATTILFYLRDNTFSETDLRVQGKKQWIEIVPFSTFQGSDCILRLRWILETLSYLTLGYANITRLGAA